jgi:hypothetical protein
MAEPDEKDERSWSLEGARAVLPDVRSRTERAVEEAERLGAEVKGVWLVDFDNGSGYYCWRWPEEKLEYFHAYEDGFAGRTRIQ